jgi:3D (Asp-Asp-Asp) domain-containing protein
VATNNSWNSQDPVQVALGGTGQATLLAHGVLVGEGTSAVTSLAVGSTGQVLTGSSAADPSFASIGTNSGLTQYGVVIAENTGAFQASNAATNGQVLLGATSANPAFATLTSTAGTIAFTTGANSLNLDVVSGGTPWTDVTGTSQAMAANNGYIADNASLVTLTLPTTIAQGAMIRVAGKGAGGWIIAQNTGQLVHFGSVTTTSGATGSLASTNQYDQIDLLCVTANTTFVVRSSIGNITYV